MDLNNMVECLFRRILPAALFAAVVADGATLTRGPYLQSCSSTSIVVRWRTDDPTDSRVWSRATNQPVEVEAADDRSVTDHEIRLMGLTADSIYSYSVGSTAEKLAEGAGFRFRTAPTNARPVRVWVIGDSGAESAEQLAVRDSYAGFANGAFTDLLLMLGDNVYGEASDADYGASLFDVYRDLLRQTVCFPAIGNHDSPWFLLHPAYLDVFTFPTAGEAGGVPSGTGLYYSYDYANIHFVCLDSWLSDRTEHGPMLSWLEADLAATRKDWIIAYWHHPPYSMSSDFSDSTPILIEMRERVVPILERYGVDLVMSGHSHAYERSFLLNGHYGYSWTLSSANVLDPTVGRTNESGPYLKPAGGMGAHRGTVYLVCGESGQGGMVSFAQHPAMAAISGGYGSVVLDIDGLRLNAKYLRSNGEIGDSFAIDKSAALARGPRLEMTHLDGSLTMRWPACLPDLALESCQDLGEARWQPVQALSHMIVGRTNIVSLGATNRVGFFRLRGLP